MARTIITHVGTSLLGCSAFARAPKLDALTDDLTKKGKDRTGDLATYAPVLEQGLKNTWKSEIDDWKRRQDSPAEIASLSLLDVQASRIILLHSDTHAGRFCARLLEQVLRKPIGADAGYPCCTGSGCSLEVVQIDDLHVNETYQNTSWWSGILSGKPTRTTQSTERDIFVRTGLTSYVRRVSSYYRDLLPMGGELLFNVTAGYKGMIPVARDLTLLLDAHNRDWRKQHRKEGASSIPPMVESAIVYVFERSNDLIHYAALPIFFDFTAFNPALLQEAGTDQGLKRSQPEPHSFFEQLLSGYWKRSALGEVVWTVYEELYAQSGDITLPPPERHQE